MRAFRPTLVLAVAVLAAVVVVPAAVAAAPIAITGPVSAVGGTSATLNGTVNPAGAATDRWFEYGTSTSYGSKTTTVAAGSGSANDAVSAAVSGLAPATTYHYRLVAKNAIRNDTRHRRSLHDRLPARRGDVARRRASARHRQRSAAP